MQYKVNIRDRICSTGDRRQWDRNRLECCIIEYVPKYEDGESKSKTNGKLEEFSKGENIVKRIKQQRVSWLGHLERMEEDRMHLKILTQEMEGTRRRGRPRKGWREEIERDLQVLVVRRCRELVIDRKKWSGIFRQAKDHRGLWRQRKQK
jgi:hypothetical protein